MNAIPSLDISRFDNDRERFLADFAAAYTEWGFAGITGHGIDLEITRFAMQLAAEFFGLSENDKKQFEGASGYERGYIPFGVEKAKNAEHVDLKEFFHIGREVSGVAHLGQNIWPTSIAGFQSTFARLFNELDALAHRILEVFALHLGLPNSYFNSRVEHGEALLRVLHYPPIDNANVPNVRAAAHEDINLLTLLVGSEQSGLEVLSRTGLWVPITMIEGTIVCNVGDMLQRLSNGLLPSTTHRVINPPGNEARVSRYSMPFFMHPSPEVRLDVLPQCVTENRPQQYEPINAGDYLRQRLNEIGLVKK